MTTKVKKWTQKKFGYGWVTTNRISYECTSRMVTPPVHSSQQEDVLSSAPGSSKGSRGTTTTHCLQHFGDVGLGGKTEDEMERRLDT